MLDEKQIELRSEELNEILTAPPNWFVKVGSGVILILIILFIALSYFIKYPDTLVADVTINTLNPPVILVCKTSGKLTQLFVKDKSFIKANQVIGVIENTADYQDVLLLEETGIALRNEMRSSDDLPKTFIREYLSVGDLTSGYLRVVRAQKDILTNKTIAAFTKQMAILRSDLTNHEELISKYKNQLSLNTEQLKISEEDFNRAKKLVDEKGGATSELEAKKKEYQSALAANEQLKITVNTAAIQKNNIEKNILQMQIQDSQEWVRFKNELLQSIYTLLAEIDRWKARYLIQSPIDGKISFFSIWAVNQNLRQGDELFYIVSESQQKYIAKCLVPITNAGKIKVGQNVNLKLHQYPYQEFGFLQGVVANISEVPNNDFYNVDVDLPKGLETSYKQKVPYRELMKGKAEIITKNISVLDRIFNNFRKILTQTGE